MGFRESLRNPTGARLRAAHALIGDSTSDVVAAREGGAKVIAVTSGRDDEQSLRGAGADAVLNRLDTRHFLATVSDILS